MTDFKINKVVPSSFAKIFALYSFFMTLLMSVIDLIIKLAYGNSMLVATDGFGSWFVYIILSLILTPVVGYILGFVMGFFINIALKVGNGLELDVK